MDSNIKLMGFGEKYDELKISIEMISLYMWPISSFLILTLIFAILGLFVKLNTKKTTFVFIMVSWIGILSIVLVFTNGIIKEKEGEVLETEQEIEKIIKDIPRLVQQVDNFVIIDGEIAEKTVFFENENTENVRVIYKNSEGHTVEKEMEVKLIKKENIDNPELSYIPFGANAGPYVAGFYEAELVISK